MLSIIFVVFKLYTTNYQSYWIKKNYQSYWFHIDLVVYFHISDLHSSKHLQPGLSGINLGKFLIKRVITLVKRDMPQISVSISVALLTYMNVKSLELLQTDSSWCTDFIRMKSCIIKCFHILMYGLMFYWLFYLVFSWSLVLISFLVNYAKCLWLCALSLSHPSEIIFC